MLILFYFLKKRKKKVSIRKNSRKKAPVDDTQKATQKRKSRPTGEGSSSGHPVVLDRQVELPPGCMEKFTFYQQKSIGTVLYFDYPVLSKYGLMSLIAPLIESPDWKHIFSIRESTLTPVTFEVLAMLKIDHLNNWTDKVVHFSAFGVAYSLSVNDLGAKMRFYKLKDTTTNDFRARLDDVLSIDRTAFWAELTHGREPYAGSKSKATALARPEFKVMHHMLARSLTSRMGAPTVVNHLDLLCLYSMVRGVRLHMGMVMVRMLQAHDSYKTSGIFIGPYLSCLLCGLRLGPQLDDERSLAPMRSFNHSRLETIGFSRVRDTSDDDDADRPPTPPPQWNPRGRARRPAPGPPPEAPGGALLGLILCS
nr:putative retrotransposon Orf1 [Ipomoea batatas]